MYIELERYFGIEFSLSLSLSLPRILRKPSSPLNLRFLLCHSVFILAFARYFLHSDINGVCVRAFEPDEHAAEQGRHHHQRV